MTYFSVHMHFNRKFRGRNVKWNRDSRHVISKNFAIPREVVLFFGNSGTDAPSLVNVHFRNFKSKFLIHWKAPTVKKAQKDTKSKVFLPTEKH